jgi:hypothetical protein
MNELISAYADAIRAIAASVHDVYDGEWGDREWERLVVDFESLAHTNEPRTSSISFAIARAPDGPLEKVSFSLSADAEEAFMRINRIMQAQKGNYWSTCQVMVEVGCLPDSEGIVVAEQPLGGLWARQPCRESG